MLTQTAGSPVTEAWWQAEEAVQRRSLADIPVLSRFLDAVYEAIRRTGSQDEAIWAACPRTGWAAATQGAANSRPDPGSARHTRPAPEVRPRFVSAWSRTSNPSPSRGIVLLKGSQASADAVI